MDADKDNAALYARRLNDYASVCQKLRADGIEFEVKNISPPPTNNTQNFHVFSARKTLVPAIEQAEAVIALENMGLRLYKDYEPQTAIARYRELQGMPMHFTPPHLPSAPEMDASPEAPPPLYPSLRPVAGMPEGYSHKNKSDL